MLSISLSLLGHKVFAIDKNYHKIDEYSQYLGVSTYNCLVQK